MRKVFILYENFYTADGLQISIGGIQTYIKMVINVIREIGMRPVVFQYASVDFKNEYNETDVYGIAMGKTWSKSKKNQVLFTECMDHFNADKDIIIFACETMVVKNSEDRVIGIQHGITWDVKGHQHYSHKKNLLFIFWRAILAYKTAKRIKNVKFLVGVDYNFLNWYRTQVAYIETEVKVIPNCTSIPQKKVLKEKDRVNIIFARRYQIYRGTRLFAASISKILMKYDNVYITFAGTGPDESFLREVFKNNTKVMFIKYDSEKSLDIHQEYHIAVVPTIGSEGTSLSLLEAMASKCAVIATNIGGMTNIVLDNYNGILINPDESQLYNAIEKLIVDIDLREKLAINGYDTVLQGFNSDLWKERWKRVFDEILS